MLIDEAAQPVATLVLAHGAGAAMDAPGMRKLAEQLCLRDLTVVRFEFPYMAKRRDTGKRSPPDRMPVLEESYRAVIAALRQRGPLFIGGRSMGGRVATHIADVLQVRGVLAFGYPFHPPAQPEKLRVSHLTGLQTPCLIVQGTRDPFGTPPEVAGYPLSPAIQLHWLEGADHSFSAQRGGGRSSAQNLSEACDAARRFVLATLSKSV